MYVGLEGEFYLIKGTKPKSQNLIWFTQIRGFFLLNRNFSLYKVIDSSRQGPIHEAESDHIFVN